MIARFVTVVSLAVVLAAPVAAQQAAGATPQPGPGVGDMAPDFTGTAADKSGTLAAPVKLADLRGKTVVLAFFPRARTSGCTLQMTQYRDQYDSLFAGGRNVVVYGVSNDADTTLTAWAREENFPFAFISDKNGAIGRAYGAMTESSTAARRFLYVIGPDGKIVHTAKQFQPARPADYTALGDAVKKAMSAATAHHH